MQHDVSAEHHGPHGQEMADAISTCVHCGFCLASCPTYEQLGQEPDSPRGRIVLMKEVLEGTLPFDSAAPHIDRCLGCLACEPACPSGVSYRDLISPFRSLLEPKRTRPFLERFSRLMTQSTLPYPKRFRLAARMGRFAKPFSRWMPRNLGAMLDLLPEKLPPAQYWPTTTKPSLPSQTTNGENAISSRWSRGRIALLTGCAQSVLAPNINTATIDVLAKNGFEIAVPPNQTCCGALSWHIGNHHQAKKFAIANIQAFPKDVRAIVSNAAGCGSGMHEYAQILRGTQYESEAAEFCDLVKDISVVLAELDSLAPIKPLRKTIRVAYHDACHLANAQGVRSQPRKLLESIPGIEVVEIPEGHMCCGSAGTYNVDQPEIAQKLGEQKVAHILSVKPDLIATGNIGCMTQIAGSLASVGSRIPVRHTVEILSDAYSQRLGAVSAD